MPPLPRGRCPDCGRSVALRKGGIVREHRPITDRNGPVCSGSGKKQAGAR